MTSFWPQANGEVERQNRHLLKVMKIVKVGGRHLQGELNKYLMADRITPHSRNGVSPAELLYGRKVRTKVPQLSQINRNGNQEVQDRDREMKQKCKDYADERRNARDSDIQTGDRVLLQQQKHDKLTTRYEAVPYSVVQRCGNQVTIESPEGAEYIPCEEVCRAKGGSGI